MIPKNFISFLAHQYTKYAEFYAGFKSVEISAPRKSYLPKTFAVY